ncbi:SSS family transporter [Dysgonomonas sp. PFB1-18]|uniref:sodium:solute symporter n=1 Tax=unclassified Dysgonomonas TaxID=2630389 RepID=UPI002474839A|nr:MULTISPECIES: sodium:solute symporter [unclassified Dysgonomonas]MDH6309733.1 SSS family transporter [Dysgonomonas sp. PF1-14]MDH6339259.1 SSS family transporter [Dysgonomonas sp. PF1-16]MDH6380758.1 SSS family transporter [Dysgonomonas sp. PFB1-18]MDH6398254.1 SSS family transporter [Dysgonomonas sp. PF1-23]
MGIYILIVIAVYFGALLLISYFVSRKSSDNEAFFLGNRQSPWFVVAIAMVGTSISGVTFVSVPGMVGSFDMTYMQMVFGFVVGYFVIAYVLLPLYYRLNLTTIYGYLEQRFGFHSYKTGASFFILSKIIGAAARLYLVAMILQALVFSQWNIPFWVTVAGIILLIWGYTFRSGIKTIIWTDTLQTSCLLLGVILIIWQVASKMDLNIPQVIDAVSNNEHSRIFVFDDWASKQNFFKQFLSGVFITIVMTGLDQDMMQKNLTCKSLKDAQKNMVTYGFAFAPINFLFLSLGVLLLLFAAQYGIALPEKSDQILPMLATEYLGLPVLIFFTIGIIAAAFSSADSALTALTTSVCVDLLNINREDAQKAKKTRKTVHVLVSLAFLIVILIIDSVQQENILDTIYKVASYTYGPLLGLFFFGLFTKMNIKDKIVPFVCILAPLLSFVLEMFLLKEYGYQVGYEILLFNGLLTAFGLLCIAKKKTALEIK